MADVTSEESCATVTRVRQILSELGPVALGPFRRADFDDIHAFASDPKVCRHQPWGPNTPEDTDTFLDHVLSADDEQRQLAVLSEERVIGTAAIWTTSTRDRVGEIGYLLHPEYWGRGYATLIAAELVRLAFQDLGLERVAASCRPENIASIRVLEKVGFQREGHLRGAVLIRGERQDSLVFGQLATDAQAHGSQH